MLPTGNPSWSEISRYDTGGSDIRSSSSRCHRQGSDDIASRTACGAFVGQQPLIDLGLVRYRIDERVVVVLDEHDPLARGQVAQAFVPRGGG